VGAAGITHTVLGAEKAVRVLWNQRINPAISHMAIVLAFPFMMHSLAALGGHVYAVIPGVGLFLARSSVKRFCSPLGIDTGIL
jgi:hypothetical protein